MDGGAFMVGMILWLKLYKHLLFLEDDSVVKNSCVVVDYNCKVSWDIENRSRSNYGLKILYFHISLTRKRRIMLLKELNEGTLQLSR